MELQTAFYIVGIVFMALSFLIIVALLIMILVIRAKINNIQRTIKQKVDLAQDIFAKLSPVYSIVRRLMKIRKMMKRR